MASPPTQKTLNGFPPTAQHQVFSVWTSYQRIHIVAEMHKFAPESKAGGTQGQIRNKDCPQQITQDSTGAKTVTSALTASRRTQTEVDLQMEKLSCWGGRHQAASGTDTQDTPASCTCLHLAASTLRPDNKQSYKLENFKTENTYVIIYTPVCGRS